MNRFFDISIQVIVVHAIWVVWTIWIAWIDWCIWCLRIVWCYILTTLVVNYRIFEVSLFLWIGHCLTSYRRIQGEVTINIWALYSIKCAVSTPITVGNCCVTVLIEGYVSGTCVMNGLSISFSQFFTIFVHVVHSFLNIGVQIIVVHAIWVVWTIWIAWIDWCVRCLRIVRRYILMRLVVDYGVFEVCLMLWISNLLTSYRSIQSKVSINIWTLYSIEGTISTPVTVSNCSIAILIKGNMSSSRVVNGLRVSFSNLLTIFVHVMHSFLNISVQVIVVYTIWIVWTIWITWVDWCVRCLRIVWCDILVSLVVDYRFIKVWLTLWISNGLTSY